MLSYSLIVALVSTAVHATDTDTETEFYSGGGVMPDRFGLGFHNGLGGSLLNDGKSSSQFDFGLDLLGQSGFTRRKVPDARAAPQQQRPSAQQQKQQPAPVAQGNNDRDMKDYLAANRA